MEGPQSIGVHVSWITAAPLTIKVTNIDHQDYQH